jgi:hypothetical protein
LKNLANGIFFSIFTKLGAVALFITADMNMKCGAFKSIKKIVRFQGEFTMRVFKLDVS